MKMNNFIIGDSSALISIFTPSDSNNKRALIQSEKFRKLQNKLIVPAEVLAETINIAGKKFGHNSTYELAQKIISFRYSSVIESSEEIRSNAIDKFKTQPASVSFTDCLVMAFADHFETKVIFGFDRSFSANGYKLLG